MHFFVFAFGVSFPGFSQLSIFYVPLILVFSFLWLLMIFSLANIFHLLSLACIYLGVFHWLLCFFDFFIMFFPHFVCFHSSYSYCVFVDFCHCTLCFLVGASGYCTITIFFLDGFDKLLSSFTVVLPAYPVISPGIAIQAFQCTWRIGKVFLMKKP